MPPPKKGAASPRNKGGTTVYGPAGEQLGFVGRPLELVPAEPAAVEWYHKVNARWIRGEQHRSKSGRVTSEQKEYAVTTGVVLGGLGLLVAYEVGKDIAQGLAGLNPETWKADLEVGWDWLTGQSDVQPANPPTAAGILYSAATDLVARVFEKPPPPPPPTPPSAGGRMARAGRGGGQSNLPSGLEHWVQQHFRGWEPPPIL